MDLDQALTVASQLGDEDMRMALLAAVNLATKQAGDEASKLAIQDQAQDGASARTARSVNPSSPGSVLHLGLAKPVAPSGNELSDQHGEAGPQRQDL